MARAPNICQICGHPTVGFHTYYKGKWQCKKSSLANPGPTADPQLLAAARQGVKNLPTASTSEPTTPAVPKVSEPTPQPSSPTFPTIAAANKSNDSTSPIREFLREYSDVSFDKVTITNNVINVSGNVELLVDEDMSQLPFKFGKVEGSFAVHGGITSCHNFPDEIGHGLFVSHCKLETLEGMPQNVTGMIDISHNQLTSFDGLPSHINHALIAVGLPEITSLKGINKIVKHLNGSFKCPSSITSHLLSAAAIKGLAEILTDNNKASSELMEAIGMVNTYLDKPVEERDLLELQEQMIDAGFDKLALL